MIKKGEHINKQDIIDFSSSVFPRTKDPINQTIFDPTISQMYNEDVMLKILILSERGIFLL